MVFFRLMSLHIYWFTIFKYDDTANQGPFNFEQENCSVEEGTKKHKKFRRVPYSAIHVSTDFIKLIVAKMNENFNTES